MIASRWYPSVLPIGLLLIVACGDEEGRVDGPAPTDVGTSQDAGSEPPGDLGTDLGTSVGPTCGDGILEAGEVCDDGNRDSDDGCSSTCAIEEGWSCEGAERSVCSVV